MKWKKYGHGAALNDDEPLPSPQGAWRSAGNGNRAATVFATIVVKKRPASRALEDEQIKTSVRQLA
jgi:hypothetical protein